MTDVPQEQEPVARRRPTILFAFLVARIISYTGILVYFFWPGRRPDWMVVGIWFWATYLSRFLATNAIADRIFGRPPIGQKRSAHADGAAAIILFLVLLGRIFGFW